MKLWSVFYIVILFSGIQRNKTESASRVNQKYVLRTNLEQMQTSFCHSSYAFNIT